MSIKKSLAGLAVVGLIAACGGHAPMTPEQMAHSNPSTLSVTVRKTHGDLEFFKQSVGVLSKSGGEYIITSYENHKDETWAKQIMNQFGEKTYEVNDTVLIMPATSTATIYNPTFAEKITAKADEHAAFQAWKYFTK